MVWKEKNIMTFVRGRLVYQSDFIFVIVCYLFGSIPFGLLLSIFLKKHDPRLWFQKYWGNKYFEN